MGIAGHDHEMTDLSPAGHEARAEAARATLSQLDGADAARTRPTRSRSPRCASGSGSRSSSTRRASCCATSTTSPRPCRACATSSTSCRPATPRTGRTSRPASTLCPARSTGTSSRCAWLRARGQVAAVRQVEQGIAQSDELAAADSFFTSFVAGRRARRLLGVLAGPRGARAGRDRRARRLRAARGLPARRARPAGARRRTPPAASATRCGRATFLGATVDLEETYQWGLEELARVVAEQEAVAAQIAGPGRLRRGRRRQARRRPVAHAARHRGAAGVDAGDVRRRHRGARRRALRHPGPGAHARVPHRPDPERRHLLHGAVSDDFTRPGRMWWSVPPEVTTFNTWREKTTVYHEGVPGHHLQIGQAVYERATLNTWRRLACWTSGYGEGWALYAERLMADLGFLDDPGDRLGMLDGQRMRAARVVFDIGVHLGLAAPRARGAAARGTPTRAGSSCAPTSTCPRRSSASSGTGTWAGPGQAPSYKIGQRLWEQTRDEATARPGRGEHSTCATSTPARCVMGSLPLDVLSRVRGLSTQTTTGAAAHAAAPVVASRHWKSAEPYLSRMIRPPARRAPRSSRTSRCRRRRTGAPTDPPAPGGRSRGPRARSCASGPPTRASWSR